MGQCNYCGAPITLSPDAPTVCRYCGRSNDPPPREVEVPVPVEIIRNVVRTEPARGGAPLLRCPHCSKKLVGVVTKGVELDGCSSCGGIWIENASAQKVLANPEQIFAELAQKAGAGARHRSVRVENPRCPTCSAVLDRAETYGVKLDVCTDHGTWFDAFELSQVLYALTKGAIGDAPPELRKIRCSKCGTSVLASRANIGPNGLVCDVCASQLQTDGIAREDAHNHSVSGALLGLAAVMLDAGSS